MSGLLRHVPVGAESVVPRGLGAEDWIRAGLILAVAVAVAWVIRVVIERGATRAELERPVVTLLARTVRNLVVLVGALIALDSLQAQVGPLLGALGIGGLAVAFAAKTILENLFASVLLRTRRPIRRGDQVRVLDHSGTVEEVNLRVVILRSYDGERVFLPCAEVLNHPIVNHTVNGLRRTTLSVGVAYDTDLDEAARVLEAALESAAGVMRDPEPEVRIERFGDSSIDFALRFWHEPDNASMWRARSALALAVKRGLDDAMITIPFPQRTIGFLSPGEPGTPLAQPHPGGSSPASS